MADRHGKKQKGPVRRVPRGGVSPTAHPRNKPAPDTKPGGTPRGSKPPESKKPKKKGN